MAFLGPGSLGTVGRAATDPGLGMQVGSSICENHSPMSELADAGMRLVVKKTFLHIEFDQLCASGAVENAGHVEHAEDVSARCREKPFRVVTILLLGEIGQAEYDEFAESEVGSEGISDDGSSQMSLDISESTPVVEFAQDLHSGAYMQGCWWIVCDLALAFDQSLCGGPPGIFLHCFSQPEVRHGVESAGQSYRQSTACAGRWADMEDSLNFPEMTGTTLFLKNLLSSANSMWLRRLFDSMGLFGKFDFVYVPVNFKTGLSYGYAFVNMVTSEDASVATLKLPDVPVDGGQTIKVCLSKQHQGLDAHIARYRNSPVMHETVPDEFKPWLLRDGQRVVFPRPTRRLLAPNLDDRKSLCEQ